MKQRVLALMLVTFLLVGLMGFSGCGGGDDDPDPLNVSGTWMIVIPSFPDMTAVLTHTGTTITGTISDNLNYSVSISGTTEAAAGATKPRTITLIITWNDGQIGTEVGTVSDNNMSMSGTHTDNFGGSSQWSASRL
jgi:hypothetical protein